MPVFIGALIGALISAMGTMVGRVLISLGISYITYSGISLSLSWAKDQVMSKMGNAPSMLLNVLGILQVGTCINIVFSAYVAVLVLKGVSAAGSITKMSIK